MEQKKRRKLVVWKNQSVILFGFWKNTQNYDYL